MSRPGNAGNSLIPPAAPCAAGSENRTLVMSIIVTYQRGPEHSRGPGDREKTTVEVAWGVSGGRMTR